MGGEFLASHALGRVGQVELITRLPQKAIIPQAVKEELLNAPKGDPARTAVESGLFEIVETHSPPAEILAWDLGKGETAVLTLGKNGKFNDGSGLAGNWRFRRYHLSAEYRHFIG